MISIFPIERQNQKVLTTEVIAEKYGATIKMISNNFNNNQNRYILGTHYFCVEADELRDFKREYYNLGIAQNVNKLYLWTEKGAFLHAKSLNTDEAWQVYEMLVDSYFQKQALKPVTLEDLIIMQAQSVKDLKSKVLEIESSVTAFVDKTDVLEKRFNNLTEIDINQPKKDVLNQYVKRYAIERCKSNFSEAWKKFDDAFYYATNMKVKIRAKNAGQSRPVWLETHNYLDTAIRIADNMLNK